MSNFACYVDGKVCDFLIVDDNCANGFKEYSLDKLIQDDIDAVEALFEAIHDSKMDMPIERVEGILRTLLEGIRRRGYEFGDEVKRHLGRVAILRECELGQIDRIVAVTVGERPWPGVTLPEDWTSGLEQVARPA
jgi:hypothetical protein